MAGQEIFVSLTDHFFGFAVSIFQSYVVPFEVVSVLLLAALVGSIVVARRD